MATVLVWSVMALLSLRDSLAVEMCLLGAAPALHGPNVGPVGPGLMAKNYECAASKAARISALIRPRGLTFNFLLFAQRRISSADGPSLLVRAGDRVARALRPAFRAALVNGARAPRRLSACSAVRSIS